MTVSATARAISDGLAPKRYLSLARHQSGYHVWEDSDEQAHID